MVDIGSGIISAIGQADDVILASPSPYNLQLLVHLTEMYCARYRVRLEPTKTKLLVYSKDKQSLRVDHALNSNTITINKMPVNLVTETDHVGVLRSCHIFTRELPDIRRQFLPCSLQVWQGGIELTLQPL